MGSEVWAERDEVAPHDPAVTFDRAGVLAGFRASTPIVLSVFAYATVWGVLARQAGLTVAEVLLMSGGVFAGSAQFVALGLWGTPLPVGVLVATTAVINLRHLLLGAALRPWLARFRSSLTYPALFFMTDENWALTMGYFARGGRNAAYLLGSGLAVYAAWVGGTTIGRLAGGVLPEPRSLGLDFAATAVFIALLGGLWRGRGDLLPWAVAAVAAIAGQRWLPGAWYVLAGALAGSLAGVATRAR